MCFQLVDVDENHHFLTYSVKTPAKIPCFYILFLAKKLIFASLVDRIGGFWASSVNLIQTYFHF